MVDRKFKKLSIVVPVFNEERYLEAVIGKVVAQPLPGGLEKELILINDASQDNSWNIMQALPEKFPSVTMQLINKTVNEGKGAALRDGFAKITGDVVIVQDADFEYDPADYPKLLQPILDDKADVGYGSRFIGEPHRVLYFWHQVANNILTTISNMLTNLNLTDMEVCYKVFIREVADRLKLKSPRFGVEPEITAKIARMRLNGRLCVFMKRYFVCGALTKKEKNNWKDAVSAIFRLSVPVHGLGFLTPSFPAAS
jgi:glycosyltransferase involved in cell wall biosynthesis